ncbi:MAG: hypothetical protein Q8R01_06870 [Ramlibacter sp.]|nr:hypothetical protein [Ramlibacter sp.]
MPVKIFAALVAVVLVVGYLAPVVLKLKEAALGIVIAVGIAMMLVDLWQSFRERD